MNITFDVDFKGLRDHPCDKYLTFFVNIIRPFHVLDLGCGAGRDLKVLHENNLCKHYSGIDDHSEDVYHEFEEIEDIEFIKEGVKEYLQTCNYTLFDFIYSNNAFERFDELDIICKYVYELLCYDGYFYVTIPESFNHNDPHHKNYFTNTQLKEYLSKFGFTIIAGQTIDGGNQFVLCRKE